jgi:hypothetical protein
MLLDVPAIYDIRENREKIECFVKNTDGGPSDRKILNIELINKNLQYTFMYLKKISGDKFW